MEAKKVPSSVVSRHTVESVSTVTTRRMSNQRKRQPQDGSMEKEKETKVMKRHYAGNGHDTCSQLDLSNAVKEDYFESGSYRRDRIGQPWRSPNLSRRGIHSIYADTDLEGRRQHSTSIITESTTNVDKNEVDKSSTPDTAHMMRAVCMRTGGTGGMCTHKDCSETTNEMRRRRISSDLLLGQNHIQHWNSNMNNSVKQHLSQTSDTSTTAVRRVSLWRTFRDNHATADDHAETSQGQVNFNARSRRGGGREKQDNRISSIFGLDQASEDTGRVTTRSQTRRLETERQSTATTAVSSSSSSVSRNNRYLSVTREESRFSKLRYMFSRITTFSYCYIQRSRDTCSCVQTYCGAPHALLIPIYLLAIGFRFLICLPCYLVYLLNNSGFILFPRGSSAVDHRQREEHSVRRRRSKGVCGVCCCCILLLLLLLLLPYLLLRSDSSPFTATVLPVSDADAKDEVAWSESLSKWLYDISVIMISSCKSAAFSVWTIAQRIGSCIAYIFSNFINAIKNITYTTIHYTLWVIQSERDADTGDKAWQTEFIPPPPPPPSSSEGSADVPSEDPRVNKILITLQEHSKRLRTQEENLKQQKSRLDGIMASITDSKTSVNELKISFNKWENDMVDIQKHRTRLDSTLDELNSWRIQISKTENERYVERNTILKEQRVSSSELQSLKALVERLEAAVIKDGHDTKAELKRQEDSLKQLAATVAATKLSAATEADGKVPNAVVLQITEQITTGEKRLATLENQHIALQKVLETLRVGLADLQQQQQLHQKQQQLYQEQQQKQKRDEQQLKVSKEEMTKTKKEVINTVIGTCGDNCITKADASLLIDEALQIFAADRLARPDFALESAGGSIVGTRCTQTYTDRPAVFSLFGVPLFRLSRSPRSVIQPAIQPGECWAFRGSKGQVVVRLSNPIVVSAITLEHIPASLSPTGRIESAPREIEVKGLESETDFEGWSLGRFEYKESGPPIQTFDIIQSTDLDSQGKRRQRRPLAFRFVELQVLSNHGHPEYTCVYRMRVHGRFLDADNKESR